MRTLSTFLVIVVRTTPKNGIIPLQKEFSPSCRTVSSDHGRRSRRNAYASLSSEVQAPRRPLSHSSVFSARLPFHRLGRYGPDPMLPHRAVKPGSGPDRRHRQGGKLSPAGSPGAHGTPYRDLRLARKKDRHHAGHRQHAARGRFLRLRTLAEGTRFADFCKQ